MGGLDDRQLQDLLRSILSSFAREVRSLDDPFCLLRDDTPEMPRYIATLRACAERAQANGPLRLCDLGGYFGVLGAAVAELGFEVHVVDAYGPLLSPDSDHGDLRKWWASRGLTVHDVDLERPGMRLPFADETFDIVSLLAVIEHFAHTPRVVLEESRRILRPDGQLIVDTPNAGALGVRLGFLLHGEGIWTPASELYFSAVPFPGHKRCYSRRELVSVIEWAGFEVSRVALFDLGGGPRGTSRAAKLFYNVIYPLLAHWFPDLRGYLWVLARGGAAPN